MMRRLLAVLAGASASSALAQAIPENSQAAKVQPAYRRTPSFRIDPFRHVSIPHWGLVASVGASGGNNALNASDLGAIIFLSDRDSLTISSMVDAMGLIPNGGGLKGFAQGEGGVYLGGPFGHRVSLGFQARGTGYGAFQLDDRTVALLRDGNGAQSNFSLGSTKAIGLATAEAGAHTIIRLGPMGSVDGVKVSLGFGARFLRPVGFARFRSLLANGGTLIITGDTIRANISVEQAVTNDPGQTIKGKNGLATDYLFRLEWPTSGLALEAMIANVGSVDVEQVEVSTATLNVNSTSLQDVQDAVDTFDFAVQNAAATVHVVLPRVVRFTASAWANRILQIDLSSTMPVTGDFETPLAVDIGTTWRFIRTLPLRAGMSIGGAEGIGFSGGVAIEGRTMFFQLGAQSLGGLLKQAKGAGARVEFGLFF
ncbi:MAG: hypothetical protein EXR93_04560 [Gemmatimonadetes bacterium]|nr:hypothetical protein [Gemmatimonadota bacterium]